MSKEGRIIHRLFNRQILDINAGAWRPILLTGPTEFPVATPIATNTPDYIAQVNEIKSSQANLTSDEKRIVKYWSAGAVLRWNEILRSWWPNTTCLLIKTPMELTQFQTLTTR